MELGLIQCSVELKDPIKTDNSRLVLIRETDIKHVCDIGWDSSENLMEDRKAISSVSRS